MSRRLKPSSEPFRNTFSRPLRSGWKPLPSSSSAATRPFIATLAAGRLKDAGHQLERGALTGAVVPDQPQAFAFADAEADVAQRPELFALRARPQHPGEAPLDGILAIFVQYEALADVFEFDNVGHLLLYQNVSTG